MLWSWQPWCSTLSPLWAPITTEARNEKLWLAGNAAMALVDKKLVEIECVECLVSLGVWIRMSCRVMLSVWNPGYQSIYNHRGQGLVQWDPAARREMYATSTSLFLAEQNLEQK